MGNKSIRKVVINAQALQEEITRNGYSIRSIGQKTSRSDRQIRYYMKHGEMPENLLKEINDVLHPKTKKIWMRIGVTVPVTDDELFDIMEICHQEYMSSFPPGHCGRADGMEDYDMNDQEAQKFLERAIADGESYIPDCCFDPYLEWWEKERERRRKQ